MIDFLYFLQDLGNQLFHSNPEGHCIFHSLLLGSSDHRNEDSLSVKASVALRLGGQPPPHQATLCLLCISSHVVSRDGGANTLLSDWCLFYRHVGKLCGKKKLLSRTFCTSPERISLSLSHPLLIHCLQWLLSLLRIQIPAIDTGRLSYYLKWHIINNNFERIITANAFTVKYFLQILSSSIPCPRFTVLHFLIGL